MRTMNMNIKKSYRLIIALISIVTVLALTFVSSFVINADSNVTILEETDPDLTFVKIHAKSTERADEIWDDIVGSFNQNGNSYTMTSNGYAQWWEKDSLHFAYKKVIFNYGKKAELVLDTQLDSWTGKNECAGAGLMIRSSTNPEAATVMVHTRPECLMITYRSADGMMSNKGPEVTITPNYPVKFRIVLNKNKATCYYKQSTDKDYINFGTIPFVYGNSVYAGLSAYSQSESDIATAKFTGYSYKVNAPEGTEVATDEGGGGETSSTEEEEVVNLPTDPEVGSDVLLSETFSDNSMTEGEASVTNPIWKTDNPATPEIVTTADKKNRYLYEYMNNSHYYAGDQSWTDYETEFDICFTTEMAPNEKNSVDLYTRLTTIDQYGYHCYVLRFMSDFANSKSTTRHVKLGYIEGTGTLSPESTMTVVATSDYDYYEKLGQTIHVVIRTFDNQITVSIDGQELLSWTDTTTNVRADGCIGFATESTAVTFDNIKVTKLEDLLGGDYDNQIAGLWDQPTPSYIKEFADAGYIY